MEGYPAPTRWGADRLGMNILVVAKDQETAGFIESHCRRILGRRIGALRVLHDPLRARDYLRRNPIDLLFLDVDCPPGDGFLLLSESPSDAFQTIVVSRDSSQACRAFEYGVLDFVEKPLNSPAIERALRRLEDLRKRAAYTTKFVSIRRRGGIQLIPLQEILFARGAGAYSELTLRNGSTVLHNKSLEKLLALLPGIFERIHKSYVVNMEIVTRLFAHEGSRYEVELDNGNRLPVGRTRVKSIRLRLDGGRAAVGGPVDGEPLMPHLSRSR